MFGERQHRGFARRLFVPGTGFTQSSLTFLAKPQQRVRGLEPHPPVWISEKTLKPVEGRLDDDPPRRSGRGSPDLSRRGIEPM